VPDVAKPHRVTRTRRDGASLLSASRRCCKQASTEMDDVISGISAPIYQFIYLLIFTCLYMLFHGDHLCNPSRPSLSCRDLLWFCFPVAVSKEL
jgi:hypothetical protein